VRGGRRRRRAIGRVLPGLVLAAAACGSPAGTAGTGAPPAPTTYPPTTARPVPTTLAPRPTAPAPASLSLPEALPANPHAPTPAVVLGRLSVPRLGVEEDLQEGITLTAIDRGPGHWPGTPAPGGLGNMVIAGHRVTHSRPFNRLDELVAGDRVEFRTGESTETYEVRGTLVVPADHIGIAAQSYAHTATLFACHPKGSAQQRIVARLRLLDETGRPVDPDDALPPLDEGSDPVTGTTLLVRAGGGAAAAAGADPLAGADG
jgi:sortase A